MRIAIMQPYFLPYIGYFQLINAVDKFVIYDNIEYTKKGWINRNRILANSGAEYITLPLKKDSDFLPVNQRKLSDNYDIDRIKILRKIKENYRKAPYFSTGSTIAEDILSNPERNLFKFILNSVQLICKYIEIETEIVISSNIVVNHNLKGDEKVIAICRALNAEQYINPIGGTEIYDKQAFKFHNIDLYFLRTVPFTYRQFNSEFIPWLSILDLIMFISVGDLKDLINKQYNLITN